MSKLSWLTSRYNVGLKKHGYRYCNNFDDRERLEKRPRVLPKEALLQNEKEREIYSRILSITSYTTHSIVIRSIFENRIFVIFFPFQSRSAVALGRTVTHRRELQRMPSSDVFDASSAYAIRNSDQW